MRSHEERVAEAKRRIAKIERAKRLRRNTFTMASAVAALSLIHIYPDSRIFPFRQSLLQKSFISKHSNDIIIVI